MLTYVDPHTRTSLSLPRLRPLVHRPWRPSW